MSAQRTRWIPTALLALVVLLVAHWFDAGVIVDAALRAGQNFDYGPVFYLPPVAHLLTAGGVVVLVVAARRSRDLVVGVVYAVVGGLIVFLPTLFWIVTTPTDSRNSTLMPQPIVNTVADWNMAISHGVTGAVYTLAGAMLLSGLAVIVVSVRKQRLAASAAPSPAPAPPSHSEPA